MNTELSGELFDIATCDTPESLVIHEPKSALDLTQSIDNHRFQFDAVYSGSSTSTQIYNSCVASMADTFLSGGSSTFIAYGQTGSGKTHTVFGTKKDPGVIMMLLDRILTAIDDTPYKLTMSFYEVYINKIYDLLQQRKPVALLEVKNSCVLQGLREVACRSMKECQSYLQLGMNGRITAATQANNTSSRSHAILQLKLHTNLNSINQPQQDYTGPVFAIVDLAGSERASETNVRDKTTLMEGAEINRSLLSLKECIRALNASRNDPKDKTPRHIPFRGSKLTMVLRDALDFPQQQQQQQEVSSTSFQK
eukprot:Partr_v1_DN28576_c0_g2_i2_m73766 putative Kinesin family member